MIVKFFIGLFGVGLVSVVLASPFKDIEIQLAQITLHSLFISLMLSPILRKIKEKYDCFLYKKIFDSKIYFTLIILLIISCLLIATTKGLSLDSIFNRDRQIREEMFSFEIPIFVTYFILFSSSIFLFYLGLLSILVRNKKIIILCFFTAFMMDGVTDSRSSVLALLMGMSFSWYLFLDKNIRSYIIVIPIIFFALMFLLFLGQERVEGISFLRVTSYFAAPALLSEEIYKTGVNLFAYSIVELIFWPLFAILESPVSTITAYEYSFYSLPNGLQMNVLIPVYSIFGSLVDTILFFLVFFLLYFITLYSPRKGLRFSGNPLQLSLVATFGPLSFMINPFLSEKSFWLYMIFVFLINTKKITFNKKTKN